MLLNLLNVFIIIFILSPYQWVFCENRTEIDKEQVEQWKILIHRFVEANLHNTKDHRCLRELLSLTELLHTDNNDDDSREASPTVNGYNGKRFFLSWKNTTSRDLWTLDLFDLVSRDMQCRLDRPPNVTSKLWTAPRYCNYETDPLSMDSFLLGYCMPGTCNETDALQFGRMASAILTNRKQEGRRDHVLEHLTCNENKGQTFVWQFYATLAVTFVALILVLIATVLDCPRHDKHDGKEIIISHHKCTAQFARMFSLQSNFKKLIHRNADTTLDSLHFVRTVAMIFIILAHMYFLMQIFAKNLDEYRNDRTSFVIQLFYNGAYLPGTFFAIGGALQTYVTLMKFHKKNRSRDEDDGEHRAPKFSLITWLCVVINRYFRIVPLYLFCIMLIVYLLPHYNRYPIWPPADPSLQCPGDVWRHMTFMNNFKQVQLCMPWTWYLAVDFQLFLVFTPVVGLFVYRPLYAFLLSMASLIAACTMRAVLVMFNDFPPALMLILPLSQYNDNFRTYSFEIYMKPYAWVPSYVVGMVTGFAVYRLRCYRLVQLKWIHKILLSIFAILCFVWVPFGLYFNVNMNFKNVIYDSLYSAFNTSAWALALAWLTIFAECYAHSALIKKFFRMKCWLVLSNLTFGCYLMHLPFAFFLIYSYTLDKGGQPGIEIGSKDLYGLFVCTLLISYVTSLFLYLLIEGPAANCQAFLFKIFFARLHGSRSGRSVISKTDKDNVALVVERTNENMQMQNQDRKDSGNEPLFKYSNNSTVRF